MSTEEYDLLRHDMWCDLLGENYLAASKNKKKKLKATYAAARGMLPSEIELDHLEVIGEEEEKTMEATMDTNNRELEQKQYYLGNRLNKVTYPREMALLLKYGLRDDPTPEDGQQTVDRILAGKYKIEKVKMCFGNDTTQIVWRDPTVVKDRPGYDAALKVLTAETQPIRDAIAIKSPEDALALLQAFESKNVQ